MNKLQQLIKAAKAATTLRLLNTPDPVWLQARWGFDKLISPETILELCTLLEKAEKELDVVEDYLRECANSPVQADRCKEAITAIQKWRDRT